ncbi:phage tail protein [Ralstonia pseudosolanacearum]|uniref:phage tail-collar fiber domain-containing protein n=1 Tax=Ralstonia pseudosolanacearum TaxID=1310165 RepID=UPI001FFA4208|nr:phage tail protein [Ralstonia pseudosolanacearum]
MPQTFFIVPTAAGEARDANAKALGQARKYTHIAVGDGGGALPTPDRDRAALVNERYRAQINAIWQDQANPGQFVAELVIPETIGGWWIRELGLIDADGTLAYYGNCPETYKPQLAEGSGRTQSVRMVVLSASGAAFELKIDPAIVLATRQYVDTTIAAELTKLDTGTKAGTYRSVTVNSRGQVTGGTNPTTLAGYGITDAVTVGQGLAAGIGADLATTNKAVGDLNALVTPGEYYYTSDNANAPSGHGVLKVWRESATMVFQLIHSSDNEVFTRYRASSGTWTAWRQLVGQAGLIAYFARTTAPNGWLKANGAAVSRTTYAALYAEIGTTFGVGDGAATFNLPDLRGEFLRGWDDGRGVDASRVFGSAQLDALQNHAHTFVRPLMIGDTDRGGASSLYSVDDSETALTGAVATGAGYRTATETRPRNIALLPCIKY